MKKEESPAAYATVITSCVWGGLGALVEAELDKDKRLSRTRTHCTLRIYISMKCTTGGVPFSVEVRGHVGYGFVVCFGFGLFLLADIL